MRKVTFRLMFSATSFSRVLLPLLAGFFLMGSSARGAVTWVHGNGFSKTSFSSLSGDGRYIAFQSAAPDLLPDGGDWPNIYRVDTVTGEIVRVSIGSDGSLPDGNSEVPSISGDGKRVAFQSLATNLAPGDTAGHWHVYVRDLVTNTTTRVSVGPGGVPAGSNCLFPQISADGNSVVFHSNARNLVDPPFIYDLDRVYVHNLATGVTTLVSVSGSGEPADNNSRHGSISADGNRIAFQSRAMNLVAGVPRSMFYIYVRDLSAGTTTLVSRDLAGSFPDAPCLSPVISGDGLHVGFASTATDVVSGTIYNVEQVYVRNLATATTTLVSVDTQGNPAVYGAAHCSLSFNGSRVAFVSQDGGLASPPDGNNATDVFVRDLVAGRTSRISNAPNGADANSSSYNPSLNFDGSLVGFYSFADNLEREDNTNYADVFLRPVSFAATRFRRAQKLSVGGTGGYQVLNYNYDTGEVELTPYTVAPSAAPNTLYQSQWSGLYHYDYVTGAVTQAVYRFQQPL